jgi:hypothetical protein
VASAYAGVGVVTPQIEAEALRLWQKFCATRSEGGNDGGVAVFCKIAPEDITENLEHAVNLPASQGGEQVVFVQPPSYHYKHDVIVSGGGGSAPKTVIYVKPAKNTNEVNIVDQTQPAGAPQKPSLYFLKGSHGGESEAVRDAQPVSPPGGTYLPPATGGYQ